MNSGKLKFPPFSPIENENLYKRELIIEKCNKIKQGIFLSVARKVAAQTLDSELVAVQPLNGPTGLINYD